MGKSAGAAPPAPDPVATANAQTQSNVQTAEANARLNRVNQYTPQGSSTWTQNPGAAWDEGAYLGANPDVQAAIQSGQVRSGQQHYQQYGQAEGRGGVAPGYGKGAEWSQTTTLSPEQQRLYNQTTQGQALYGDAAISQLGKLGGILSQPVNFDGVPKAGDVYGGGAHLNPTITRDAYGAINPTITQDAYSAIDPTIGYGAQSRARVEGALQGRLQPMQDAQRAATETRLRNQGLVPGSEAYTNAMDNLGRQENDARLGIISQGGQEESVQATIADMLYGQQAQNKNRMLAGQTALFGQQDSNRQAALAGQTALFGQQVQGQQLDAQGQAQQFNQQNQIRQAGINELLSQRQIPLNEISALLGGQQVQYPIFGNTPQVQQQTTDVTGAYGLAQQGQNAAYGARAQAAASGNAGTAGLLGAGITGAAVII